MIGLCSVLGLEAARSHRNERNECDLNLIHCSTKHACLLFFKEDIVSYRMPKEALNCQEGQLNYWIKQKLLFLFTKSVSSQNEIQLSEFKNSHTSYFAGGNLDAHYLQHLSICIVRYMYGCVWIMLNINEH